MHLAADDTHHQIEHHPLRSFFYVDNASSFNKDGYSEGDRNDYNNDNSDISDFISAESGVCSDDIMLTDSLTITKKHKDNKVQPHQSYKSSSII